MAKVFNLPRPQPDRHKRRRPKAPSGWLSDRALRQFDRAALSSGAQQWRSVVALSSGAQ